jgi:hypothetical protein
VSENQALELGLLRREAGVDKRQPVLALDQEGACPPHRDNVHALDHMLRGHRQSPAHSSHRKCTRTDCADPAQLVENTWRLAPVHGLITVARAAAPRSAIRPIEASKLVAGHLAMILRKINHINML